MGKRLITDTHMHTTQPWATSPPTDTPTSNPYEPTGEGGSGWVAISFGRYAPDPLRGARLPRPPAGGWGGYSRRSGPAVVAGSRLRHILIGILSGPAPVWEGGDAAPTRGAAPLDGFWVRGGRWVRMEGVL